MWSVLQHNTSRKEKKNKDEKTYICLFFEFYVYKIIWFYFLYSINLVFLRSVTNDYLLLIIKNQMKELYIYTTYCIGIFYITNAILLFLSSYHTKIVDNL